MNTFTKKIYFTGICLLTAAALVAPGVSHAGWFSDAPKPFKKVSQVVKGKAGDVQAKVGDIAGKLDEIYSQMEDNRPLLNALKNGKMMKQLTEVVTYLNESQQDYQAFAENGVYTLRDDVKNLVGTVTDVSDMLNLDGKLSDQLNKAAGLVDKMPTTFLFALAKSGVDKKLQDIVARLSQLRDDLVLVVTLPAEKEVFLYPELHKDSLCDLVNASATDLAVLNARIDYNIWSIAKVSELMPEDLTVNVTVVGGGGATISKFPPQYIFKAITAILEVIKMRLSSYASIAGTLECSAQ